MRLILLFLFLLSMTNSWSQSYSQRLKVISIEENQLTFDVPENSIITYYEQGIGRLESIQGKVMTGLKPATFYTVSIGFTKDGQHFYTAPEIVSTKSKSSGDITVYFNQTVNNSASSIADAIQITDFEDTIISYINKATLTLDIANYNTGSINIVNAINSQAASGVIIRYIAADNTGTNNGELSNLSGTIPMIQRPNDGEVMHNKFILVDASDVNKATVLTGSTNHTNNSMHNDYNNLVIVEDQALVLAYELEFEEMWGSSTNLPDPVNAKFGVAKTDNTPHNFNIGGVPVELYFSPSDGTTAKIVTALGSAQTDICFALLTYTNNDLGDAVVDAHNAGVNCRGLINNTPYFGSEYNALLSAGVEVYDHFTEPYFLHHKYAIVDATDLGSDPLVITGSHNWSNSAEDDYDENTLIIHDATIANMYLEEFEERVNYFTGTGITTVDLDGTVFPNPFIDQIEISLPGIVSYTLMDELGRTVLSRQEMHGTSRINVSSVVSGTYLLKLETESGTVIRKMIKATAD
ncbi:MAG: T9SS type A sorting domain-containing protein [Flavobacteriales bacterium]|nr:T9SS type A sorting domain-containing protein [Flavobacteriales bacterium]